MFRDAAQYGNVEAKKRVIAERRRRRVLGPLSGDARCFLRDTAPAANLSDCRIKLCNVGGPRLHCARVEINKLCHPLASSIQEVSTLPATDFLVDSLYTTNETYATHHALLN